MRMKLKKIATLAILTVALLSIYGCEVKKNTGVMQYTNTDFVMDTVLNVTIYGEEDLFSTMKERLSDLEVNELSWREEGSMAAKVNEGCASGETVTVDEDFAGWVKDSLILAEKSQGAFDPSIGNLSRLWNIEGDDPHVPAQEDIDQCLKEIGYKHINIEETEISVEGNARLDLGAVGKGIGCDVANEYLDTCDSVKGATVSIGGSVLVYGQKPDGNDWYIGIQEPDAQTGEYVGYISLEGTNFISTSGDYEKYFEENGKRYHHILDASTGYPAESGLRSVTIIAKNGLISDGLSTACFVLGEEKGMELAKECGAECIMINDNNEITMTDGIKDRFKLTNEAYTEMK